MTISDSSFITRIIKKLKNLNISIHVIFASVIAFIALSLYINTLSYNYILDDHQLIEKNTLVSKGLSGIPHLLSSHYWAGTKQPDHGIYRPLSLITFAVEKQLFGYNPAISRFVNILLYIFTGTLMYLILTMLFKLKSPWIPFLITVLFISHPVHTEVIATIKGRCELLSLLNGLLALYFTIRLVSLSENTTDKFINCLLSGFFFMLALLSKEIAFAFIIIIPSAVYFFYSNKPLNHMIIAGTYLITAFIYFIARILVLGGLSPGFREPIIYPLILITNIWDRLATALFIMGNYLKLLIIPHPLNFDYSFAQIPTLHLSSSSVVLTIISLAILITIWFFGIKSKSPLSFGIISFLCPLGILFYYSFAAGYSMADRLLYLPSFGFCIAIVSALSALKLSNKKIIIGILSISIIFIILSFERIPQWKNELTISLNDIKTADKSCRAHYLAGTYMLKESQYHEDYQHYINAAISALRKAVQIHPNFAVAYYNLGIAYEEAGKPLYAETAYKHSLLSKLRNADLAIKRLYEINKQTGDTREADYYKNLI
ncbi:tetratricopeptide repeat protein [Thermoproteota archaeon]